jgi:hypothetical protein
MPPTAAMPSPTSTTHLPIAAPSTLFRPTVQPHASTTQLSSRFTISERMRRTMGTRRTSQMGPLPLPWEEVSPGNGP